MSKGKNSNNLKPINERFSINESRHLGKGCFGIVYEGFDNETGKVIAIKHLNKPENFQGEIETLENLSTLTHPNIMGFYGYKADKDDVYLFVEYCPGGVLTELIKKGLDEERVLDLFRQLVQGMCYLNAKGIMHRDLKPDNILIGKDQSIKISDFGLARIQDGLEKTGQTGTPLYAGPEIYTNIIDTYNMNCDVWSAGLILHEMLTGKHPMGHVNKISDLKHEWTMFQKGQRRITYPKTMNPQWQYLTNIMLTHNFKKRPMFHDILELLKKLDDHGTMRQEIRNARKGIKVHQNSKEAILDSYLSYIQQKSNLLVEFIGDLDSQKYPHMRNSLKNIILFLSVTWYVVKIKNLIRSLKFKNLKYPNGQEVISRTNPDEKCALIMDKYRNIFEAKLTKNQNFLKEKIMPKLEESSKQSDELKTLRSIDSAYKLYLEAKQGTYDVEETYKEKLIEVLAFHKVKPTQQKLTSMTIEQNKIYAKVLLAGLLDLQFPDQMFMEKGFIDEKLKILSIQNQAELLNFIFKLKSKVK